MASPLPAAVRDPAPLPEGAKPAALPATLSPELATLVPKPQPGKWLYEIKLDGYRLLARVDDAGRTKLVTREGHDWSSRFPKLRHELHAANLPAGWYDGEIVILDSHGLPDFNALQNAISGERNAEIVLFLFDAPYVAGHDLRAVPVEERRRVLRSVLENTAHVRFSEELEFPAKDLVASACKMGLEGIIGKRRGSAYVHGRTNDWIKLKCLQRQEFVIGGYVWPLQDRQGSGIGALLVGYFDDEGTFRYAGKVGTGFTGAMSAELRRRLDAIAQDKRPFADRTGHERESTWVRPEIVCEATFTEWPDKLHLRHASFKGLREDKPATSVRREGTQDREPAARRSPPPKVAITGGKLRVTHPDRVIDTSTGFTKLDLVTYYAHAARWAMPYLQDRPVFIRRVPKNVQEGSIFQEHTLDMRGLKSMDSALWPGHDPAISIQTAEDLVLAAQFDAVELHTWNSTARAITQPDRMVFDLDRGKGVSWGELKKAAVLVRTMLQELGLRSWVKTSGGNGLHVYVPLQPDLGYADVKAFAQAVVVHLAKTLPQVFVAVSGERSRVGRVFVDYLRNGWVQTTAEAFSARARPGMGVSMPMRWEELDDSPGPDAINIRSAIDHLARWKASPWAEFWKGQPLRAAMRRLGVGRKGVIA